MPIALLILLILGGGTGIVAENSLPGDILYPVKINVNEKLESVLAVTAKGDAEVSVRQAAERLSEAEKLKDKGNLSAEQSISLKNSFLSEIGSVNKNLQKIKEKGDSKSVNQINSELEKEINEHSNIVATLGIKDDDIDKEDEDSQKEGIKSSTTVQNQTKTNKKDDVERVGDDDSDDEEEGDDDGPKPLPPVQVKPQLLPPTSASGGNTGSTVAKYTMAQVALHNKSADCWSVVNGGVYNLTSWISQHPGGASAIISLCGIDGTSGFMSQHGGQGNPERELALFKIGILQ